VGINKRVSLRKFVEDIRHWVEEGRSDDWIASALGTSASSVQSFRSRNAIYRRGRPRRCTTRGSSPPTRGARARGTRGVVRPRDRLRSALAEALEEHREGGAAPDADQVGPEGLLRERP
jgi:hypothetical protein